MFRVRIALNGVTKAVRKCGLTRFMDGISPQCHKIVGCQPAIR